MARRTTPTPSATSTATRAQAEAPRRHLGAPRPRRQGPRAGPARQLRQGRRRRRRLEAHEHTERRLPAPRALAHVVGAREGHVPAYRGPAAFTRLADDWPAGTAEVANILDRLEVPLDANPRDAARLSRHRRRPPQEAPRPGRRCAGAVSVGRMPHEPFPKLGKQPRERAREAPELTPTSEGACETHRETPGNTLPGIVGNSPPP